MSIPILSEYADKMGTIIIIGTITQFMNMCIDSKMQPTIEELTKFIKEKTGKDVDSEMLKDLLNIALNNIQIAILFAINEASEKIAEEMLDKKNNALQWFKGLI